MKIIEITNESISEVVGFVQNSRTRPLLRKNFKGPSLADLLVRKHLADKNTDTKSEIKKLGKDWASAK